MKLFSKIALIASGALFLIWFALPAVFGVLNSGNFCGILCSMILIFYGIFMTPINRALVWAFQRLWGKIAISTFAFLCLVILSFVLVTTVQIVAAANNAPTKETTVVVLGCRVYESGPSNLLRKRLDAAYEYLDANPEIKCILSGGQGADEPTSEAFAMKAYLVNKGIDPDRLYVEDKSTSTRENLAFSNEIIKNEGLCPDVTIITNDFHQYRASRVAKALGIESYSISGSTPLYLLPTYYVRELGGALYEIFVR